MGMGTSTKALGGVLMPVPVPVGVPISIKLNKTARLSIVRLRLANLLMLFRVQRFLDDKERFVN
jgi:hypothetical protein